MSTRQATPGPSNVSALNTISINSRKRGVSQSDALSDSIRKPKKSKGDDPRDKKKRRRKRRKISVTAPSMLSLSSSRSRSKSRTMTAEPPTPINDPTESYSTLSVAVKMDQEEEKVRLFEEDEVSEASSSKVDKGKGKAKEESPSALDTNSSHEVEIARLKKEIEAQKLLLQRHQSHLNQIQQSLSCEICLDLMHRPFALAPCGHVACHTCLVAWFTREDERTAGFLQRQNHFNRKKTCPVCRALITQRPAEVWGLKSMVSNFHRSGLIEPSTLPFPLPNAGPDGANLPVNNSGENNDPWQNIFRSARSERGPLSPINHPGGGGIEDIGIYDEEDGGVYRCIDCINEIVGNRCTGCLRIYPGHAPEDDDEDDFDDEDDDDLDPDDMRGDNPVLQNLLNALANSEPIDDDYDDYESEVDHEILEYFGGGQHFGSEDEYEDAEEDDEEVGGHRGFGFGLGVGGGMGYPLTGDHVPHWIDQESEDEDEPSAYIEEIHGREDEEDEDEEGHFGQSFINDEEEEEEDSDGSSIYASPVITGSRRRPETVVLSDDDEEEEDDEIQFLGPARRAGSRYRNGQRSTHVSGSRAAVIISSDEED